MSARSDWPTKEPTADEMLRFFLTNALHFYGMCNGFMDAGAFERFRADPLDPVHNAYMRATSSMIDYVDQYVLLKALIAVAPADAETAAAELWLMADAGDGYGEWLWEWHTELGIDPDKVLEEGKAAAAAHAAKYPEVSGA